MERAGKAGRTDCKYRAAYARVEEGRQGCEGDQRDSWRGTAYSAGSSSDGSGRNLGEARLV